MIPVAEARARIVAAMPVLPAETVSLAQADGRVLAQDLTARLTQPPCDLSAMDGYAVDGSMLSAPARLPVVARIAAGRPDRVVIRPGEAARIFTGAAVPEGADRIVLQEDAEPDGDHVVLRDLESPGRHIRRTGQDFVAGATILPAGRRLDARALGLAAAANLPWLPVRRRPRVALMSSGDEIVRPGEPVGPRQIVSANAFTLAALIRAAGGEAVDLGIAPDSVPAIDRLIAAGVSSADLIVTTGGASVGDHDLMQAALVAAGARIDFWRIAMRPGKPLMFGQIGDVPVLGLPGNPVSAFVCAFLFLTAALERMQGGIGDGPRPRRGVAGRALAANDKRADFLRATVVDTGDGPPVVTPFAVQDSAMLSRLAEADGLLLREPFAPAEPAGAPIAYLPV